MNQSRVVIRREPVLLSAEYDPEDVGHEWFVYREELQGGRYPENLFHKYYIDAELAADLAWNAQIEQMIESHKREREELGEASFFTPFDDYITIIQHLRNQLRPIATEGDGT